MTSEVEFHKRRAAYERQIEDVLIDISNEKTVNGLSMLINVMPVAAAFRALLDRVEEARLSTGAPPNTRTRRRRRMNLKGDKPNPMIAHR